MKRGIVRPLKVLEWFGLVAGIDPQLASICPPDSEGLMRLQGTNLCLQASHGPPARFQNGSKLRVYPCNKTEQLQQFQWTDDSTLHPLKLLSEPYSDYCVTNRGVEASDGDPIIVKRCSEISPVERRYWWGD